MASTHARCSAALPRLAHGEGWVWASSDGVLAQVSFPRISTFDSSRTPQQDEQVTAHCTLAVVDHDAIRAALDADAASS